MLKSDKTILKFDITQHQLHYNDNEVYFHLTPCDNEQTITIDWDDGNGEQTIPISENNKYSHIYHNDKNKIKTIAISNNIKTFGSKLDGCLLYASTSPNLIEIVQLGDKINHLCEYLFQDNKNITEFTIPKSIESFSNELFKFSNNNLKKIVFNNDIKEIPDDFF